MKKCALFFLFNAYITLCNAQAPAATDTTAAPSKPKSRKAISIGPLTMHYKLGQGQTGKQTLSFINNTNQRVSFNLEIADWDLDSLGKDVYYNAGDMPSSCARYISLDKTYIDVMPKAKEAVTVTMTLPDSATAVNESKWSLIFIKSMAEKKAPIKSEDGSVTLQPKRETAIVCRIYQTPANTGQLVKEIKMEKVERLNNTFDSSVLYGISCTNTGNTLLMSSFSMDLSSTETGEKRSVQPVKTMLLPGRKRNVELKLQDVPKGKYTAVAMITPDDEDVPVEAAQQEIEIN